MKLHQPSALSIWLMCRGNKSQGLTLIEFLVLVFVIGIWAAVALPSLLSQPHRNKDVEARNILGVMNRGQVAYFTEKNAFAGSIEKLGIGIKSETTNYRYLTQKTNQAAFNYAISKVPTLKSYAGAVWTETPNINGIKEELSLSILCEAKEPGATKPADPVYNNGGYVCGKGTVTLGL